MNVSLFDILSAKPNLKKEIAKLYKLFSIDKIILVQESCNQKPYYISYRDFCDRHLYLWNFRNTCTSLYEIEEEIGIFLQRKTDVLKTCILYCELILNMKKFLETKIKVKYYKVILNDEFLIGNVKMLVKKLGYNIKSEKNKVRIVKSEFNIICKFDFLIKEKFSLCVKSSNKINK